jgi:putative transposase
MNKAFEYRIYPTKEQIQKIESTFGCVRFIYNQMLNEKIEHYKNTGKTLYVTPAKYKKQSPFLKEVDSLALCNAQLNLDKAYKSFFIKQNAFPKFKTKKSNRQSYTTNNVQSNIRIENGKLRLPKVGFLKTVFHREIPKGHRIKSVTVSRNPSGQYHASILTEYDKQIQVKDIDTAIGLDMSMKHFYVSSENDRLDYDRLFRNHEEKLAKEQKSLSRKKKGSNRYKKQLVKVAKVHQKISNKRQDFQHKESRKLVNNYDLICIEDLNLKGMSQSRNMGKSTHDIAWGSFVLKLEYKSEELGKTVQKIDRFFPSSKTCNECGYIHSDLQRSDEFWTCESCGTHHDRDFNASKNILFTGLRTVASTGIARVNLDLLGLLTVKPSPLGKGS